MKKTIGALIGTALLAMPGAAFAQYYDYGYDGYPYTQDNCYCSGQGGFYRDPVLYSYSPVYGYGGAGYDFDGNYGYIPPTYSYPSVPPRYYPQYSYPTYNYPSYNNYPQYSPQYYYPQQQYYNPYIYNTNTNLNNNINNIVNNNNSNAIAFVYGW